MLSEIVFQKLILIGSRILTNYCISFIDYIGIKAQVLGITDTFSDIVRIKGGRNVTSSVIEVNLNY